MMNILMLYYYYYYYYYYYILTYWCMVNILMLYPHVEGEITYILQHKQWYTNSVVVQYNQYFIVIGSVLSFSSAIYIQNMFKCAYFFTKSSVSIISFCSRSCQPNTKRLKLLFIQNSNGKRF